MTNMANLMLDELLWTTELRRAFARTCGSVRIGEALWQRLDREPLALEQRWCDRLASLIEDDVALVDGLRDELARDSITDADEHVTDDERSCLRVVLDPGTTTFRALHAAIVASRAESDAWGALVGECVQRRRHALAELCLIAQERAHARIAAFRCWLEAMDELRVRRHYV
jgi:hypothetical protein